MAETTTLTLTEFLLARIAEDEASAQAATSPPWFRSFYLDSEDGRVQVVGGDPDTDEGGLRAYISVAESAASSPVDFDHILRHDPARVLAECEARGDLLKEHAVTETSRSRIEGGGPFYSCETCDPFPPAEHPNPGACLTLRLLALPYADHPDYREEWHARS